MVEKRVNKGCCCCCFSRKATLNRLKAFLEVLIYANLRHGVQMFSQISRIPDLIRTFERKRAAYTLVFTVTNFQIPLGLQSYHMAGKELRIQSMEHTI